MFRPQSPFIGSLFQKRPERDAVTAKKDRLFMGYLLSLGVFQIWM
jgi:hypothetical protein